jgi:LysM repeat protein
MRRILILGTALALSLALAAPVSAEGSTVHVVQPGENLFRIALHYGVTVDALAAANGLSDARRIYTGQRLVIPTRSSAASATTSSSGVHVAQKGENLFRIALRYGTTYQALAAANGIANPNQVYAGQKLVIPARGTARSVPAQPTPSGQTYTVRRGDILSAIARRHGVSTWELAQANSIRNPSTIYAGQVLRIPDRAIRTNRWAQRPLDRHRPERAAAHRLRREHARAQHARLDRTGAHTHPDGPVPRLRQARFHTHVRPRLLSSQRALRDVLSPGVWHPRHVLAFQLWPPDEPRLRQPAHGGSTVALQLGFGGHAGEYSLLKSKETRFFRKNLVSFVILSSRLVARGRSEGGGAIAR